MYHLTFPYLGRGRPSVLISGSANQPTITLQLPATTTLDETFTEDLRDPTSARFKQIEEAFCDQVDVIFHHQASIIDWQLWEPDWASVGNLRWVS